MENKFNRINVFDIGEELKEVEKYSSANLAKKMDEEIKNTLGL